MAYRFNDVECDSLEELLALRRSRKPRTPRPKMIPKIRKLKGKLRDSWAKARREAKRQNRDDVAAVRSEIAAAKRAK